MQAAACPSCGRASFWDHRMGCYPPICEQIMLNASLLFKVLHQLLTIMLMFITIEETMMVRFCEIGRLTGSIPEFPKHLLTKTWI